MPTIVLLPMSLAELLDEALSLLEFIFSRNRAFP